VAKKEAKPYIECFFGLQSKWLKEKEVEMEAERYSRWKYRFGLVYLFKSTGSLWWKY